MKILGVKIDNLTKKEILEKIEFFLMENKFHQIATVNPEFILEAQNNLEFHSILNNTALNVADGVGIWYAFLRYGKFLKKRFAGADVMHEILRIANDKEFAVFLAVNKYGMSNYQEIRTALQNQYPNIKFSGKEFDPEDSNAWKIEAESCELIFCNFGAPAQEIFIDLAKNDTIRLAMGVGGSFDYVTGKAQRAPKILQKIGLEWFWRMLAQPWRWRRIVNAVFIFPFKIIYCKNHE